MKTVEVDSDRFESIVQALANPVIDRDGAGHKSVTVGPIRFRTELVTR